jgi:hypothetical protein
MHTNSIGWIKRRARRLQRGFAISRQVAVMSAREDWLAFRGPVAPTRSIRTCDELGLCQLHTCGRRACDACPYEHMPRNAPPFAPGVVDGPHRQVKGLRAILRNTLSWLMGPTP